VLTPDFANHAMRQCRGRNICFHGIAASNLAAGNGTSRETYKIIGIYILVAPLFADGHSIRRPSLNDCWRLAEKSRDLLPAL